MSIYWHQYVTMKRGNKMGKASTQSKEKYNKAAYTRYVIRIRKDGYLDERIKEFMKPKGTSLNYLVTKLLTDYFGQIDFDEMNP